MKFSQVFKIVVVFSMGHTLLACPFHGPGGSYQVWGDSWASEDPSAQGVDTGQISKDTETSGQNSDSIKKVEGAENSESENPASLVNPAKP